jgi:methylmalonyl-CoA mutase N-terminal domain/subunit
MSTNGASTNDGERRFMTTSSVPIERAYESEGARHDTSSPGEYPFTRGIHKTGYRGKPWTMRMFAGFGSAEETNARFRYLLSQGNSGLSIAFDMATLYGYDTDAPEALGEFGKCGVAVAHLRDMEILLDQLPLAEITTSMTINSPAAVIWAMYIAAAEKRGVKRSQLAGTLQNDILKEFIAQKEFLFPPEPSMRLVVDTIEFGSREMPKWNTVSIAGYHIREAGSTAVQELAFTLSDGFEYVRWCLDRGLDIDDFAARLSFFFNSHNDLFEEVAKFRAARRIWATEMRETFGAKNERSWWLRFHTQTAGVSLTAQQPEVNLVRTAIQALAAVLGGTQSLHTNSLDEALALPSAKAARLAFRTQQIMPDEYLGGVLPASENGFFQREIADAAFRYQREINALERTIVGVNDYVLDEPIEIPILDMDPQGYDRQVERLAEVRRSRDDRETSRTLTALESALRDGENVMPYLLDAVNAYATLQECCDVMRDVLGVYTEAAIV